MIHLSKHSRGSVRSGSQHSADRCFSLWPDRTHTSKMKPDFALGASTQRQCRAALYWCTSGKALVNVCSLGLVCPGVCLFIALPIKTGYCQFLFAVLRLCLPIGYLRFGCLRPKHTARWRRCLLFILPSVCHKRTAADYLILWMSDRRIEPNYWLITKTVLTNPKSKNDSEMGK